MRYRVTHSIGFMLVNRRGRIRDSYVGANDDDLAKLEADARLLLASGEWQEGRSTLWNASTS